MSYHYRFTPYDISGYNFNWMDEKYDRFIVAYEDKDKFGDPAEPHFHIYLESTQIDDTIRNHFRKALNIPTVGRGQGNKYSMLKPWDGIDYICKYGDIRVVKGFGDDQIADAQTKGQKYLKKKPLDTTILEAYAKGREAGKEEGITKIRKITLSKDQEIIADLTQWYIEYKREYQMPPDTRTVIDNACRITRNYHKGINIFKVRDYVHTVIYEDEDTKYRVIENIRKLVNA